MNTILLQPIDVLFFRDGRPMTGSFAGHGAAWPLPNVVNAAFHAALHRAALPNVHPHRQGTRGFYANDAARDRKFGSLVTAGPFPVNEDNGKWRWFFPRPLDLLTSALRPSLVPIKNFDANHKAFDFVHSGSLPKPLKYAVGNTQVPSKDLGAKAWLSKEDFERYLQTGSGQENEALDDNRIFDQEHAIGIAIDPATGTTGQGDVAGKIYSAHYLRLRDSWRLGVFAMAEDKRFRHDQHGNDLVKALLNGGERQIVIGGQQRTCTAEIVYSNGLQLPVARTTSFRKSDNKVLVKWILLSPAIWPEIQDRDEAGKQIVDRNGQSIRYHPGGWMPNWIDADNGRLLLHHRAGHRRRDYSGPKARRVSDRDESIGASLVAALVPKPLVVTGWALPDEGLGEKGGAQSTHLAVPAGAAYYFEADSEREAEKLASALNWHGDEASLATIENRRSTLLGEKGFGLGICGTWDFYQDVVGHQKSQDSTEKS